MEIIAGDAVWVIFLGLVLLFFLVAASAPIEVRAIKITSKKVIDFMIKNSEFAVYKLTFYT